MPRGKGRKLTHIVYGYETRAVAGSGADEENHGVEVGHELDRKEAAHGTSANSESLLSTEDDEKHPRYDEQRDDAAAVPLV